MSCVAQVATGVPGLDTILGGGLPVRGVTLVFGHTGSGKSVLGHQLCRLRLAASRYVNAVTPPPEAVAIRHPKPSVTYFDLCPAASSADDHDALCELEGPYAGPGVELVVIDTLDGLWTESRTANVRLLCRLAELSWREAVATVLLTSPGLVASGGPVITSSAACVLELARSLDDGRRWLRVHKREGREHVHGEQPFTIGPCGLVVDGGDDKSAGRGLDDRVLSVFRTARHATAGELARLLGREEAEIIATLEMLTGQGRLSADGQADGVRIYTAIRPG